MGRRRAPPLPAPVAPPSGAIPPPPMATDTNAAELLHLPNDFWARLNTPLPVRRKSAEGIDWEVVQRLAEIQCTVTEIAHVCGCSVDALKAAPEFEGIWQQAVAEGKMSLRRKQWQILMGSDTVPPSVTMAIWLGKQYLGQEDSHKLTGADGGPLVLTVRYEDRVPGGRRSMEGR